MRRGVPRRARIARFNPKRLEPRGGPRLKGGALDSHALKIRDDPRNHREVVEAGKTKSSPARCHATDCRSAGGADELSYSHFLKNRALHVLQQSFTSASTSPQRPI